MKIDKIFIFYTRYTANTFRIYIYGLQATWTLNHQYMRRTFNPFFLPISLKIYAVIYISAMTSQRTIRLLVVSLQRLPAAVLKTEAELGRDTKGTVIYVQVLPSPFTIRHPSGPDNFDRLERDSASVLLGYDRQRQTEDTRERV